jgi:glycosyltransferase involved in cell wall biosynthesis
MDAHSGIGQTSTRPLRIAVLNTHPIQYFAPLYAYLNAFPDLNITALYLSDFSLRGGADAGFKRPVEWDLDLLAGYDSVFLGRARRRVPSGFFSLIAPELWGEVRSGHYDVLWLHGHNYAANLIALGAAKSCGIPVLMRSDTHGGLVRSKIKMLLRKPVLRSLYGLCDGVLAIGKSNADFYRSLGVPDRKIFLLPFAVDNERFIRDSRLSWSKRASIRSRWDLPPDVPTILYAGKLIARKRPLDVIAACSLIRKRSKQPFALLVVGTGELESEARRQCASAGLDNVVFAGFVNQSQLPQLYGACDIFVLPSQDEPWGLAVNEAMCAALPIVLSREVGSRPDLVKEGTNGFAMAAGDIEGLSWALQRLIEEKHLREQFGNASLERIREWGYPQCLDGLRAAISSLKAKLKYVSTE